MEYLDGDEAWFGVHDPDHRVFSPTCLTTRGGPIRHLIRLSVQLTRDEVTAVSG